MKIGDLARRTDLSRDTIRFYERNGLILSAPSTARTNSYRNYAEATVERLAMIREAQAAGFSIADLQLFILQIEATPESDFDADDFLQRKIDEVTESIKRSRAFLEILKSAQKALQGPH